MQQRWLFSLASVLLLVTTTSTAIAPASSSNANLLLRTYMHQVLEAAQERQENRFGGFLSSGRNLALPWDVGTLAVNSAFDDTLRTALEGIRKVLAVALEPLEIDRISLDADIGPIKSKGYLQDVAVHQLSEFKVEDVQSNIERLYVRLGVKFENLDLYGYYDVNAVMDNNIHVFGNGSMKMRAYELVVNASTKFAYKDQHFQVKDLKIDIGLAKVKIIMENLMGGGAVGDVTNGIISDVLPAYVDEFREEISIGASAAAMTAINEKLEKMSLDDILELAGVPKPTPKPPLHS